MSGISPLGPAGKPHRPQEPTPAQEAAAKEQPSQSIQNKLNEGQSILQQMKSERQQSQADYKKDLGRFFGQDFTKNVDDGYLTYAGQQAMLALAHEAVLAGVSIDQFAADIKKAAKAAGADPDTVQRLVKNSYGFWVNQSGGQKGLGGLEDAVAETKATTASMSGLAAKEQASITGKANATLSQLDALNTNAATLNSPTASDEEKAAAAEQVRVLPAKIEQSYQEFSNAVKGALNL